MSTDVKKSSSKDKKRHLCCPLWWAGVLQKAELKSDDGGRSVINNADVNIEGKDVNKLIVTIEAVYPCFFLP